MSKHLNSRWSVERAVVSGAASGIGQAAVEDLLRDGASVIAVDLNLPQSVIEDFQALAIHPNQMILPVTADVTDAPGLRESVAEAVAEMGAPDFALNCAGIQRAGNFEQISDADYSAVINVNLLGSRNFALAVLPHLSTGGQFALLASMGGLVGNYGYSAYAASKFGVIGLAEVLRLE